ncbi:hypothetical protein NNO07_22635 [Pseudomonas resinovorans]|uniref:Uncharacterized protein n=1 Tax=Metapseudomonas resinovorans TaxID=53412 RepID=A0ABT4YB69_METRE|nr:hypothetical protein [Pseudomonas resinovorans]MDA8485874.1 hypothetical protein [Pseudomonas resinovorans]
MDYGDIPAWIALILSLVSLRKQHQSEKGSKTTAEIALKVERLDAIESSLTQVRTSAIAYWLHPEAVSAKDGLMLLHYLKELSADVSSYSNLLWPDAWRDVLELKMQTTGSNFQQANRTGLPANDPLIRAFTDTAAEISRKLKRARDEVKSS